MPYVFPVTKFLKGETMESEKEKRLLNSQSTSSIRILNDQIEIFQPCSFISTSPLKFTPTNIDQEVKDFLTEIYENVL